MSTTSASSEYEIKWRDCKTIKKKWDSFTKFGSATATEMTGKNFDKWLKDAGIIDQKKHHNNNDRYCFLQSHRA